VCDLCGAADEFLEYSLQPSVLGACVGRAVARLSCLPGQEIGESGRSSRFLLELRAIEYYDRTFRQPLIRLEVVRSADFRRLAVLSLVPPNSSIPISRHHVRNCQLSR
jgi:hypothetical protein